MSGASVVDTADARGLMQRVLADGAELGPEYPLIFRDEFPGRVLALHEGAEVRSTCAILLRELLADGSRFRGGLIGSVATDPAWRGRGLATRVLLEAEEALGREGCVLALLWAEDPEFYIKRGYAPIGAEEDFLLPAGIVPLLPAVDAKDRVRERRPDDAPAIHALYEVHRARLARTAEETAALLECPGMTTLVLERAGEPVAYTCLGRGRDLADAVHEWGGAADDVLVLLCANLERRFPGAPQGEDGALFLMAPPVACAVADRLRALGAPSHRGILGLGKILDRRAAAELLDARLEGTGHAEVAEDAGDGAFRLRGPKNAGPLDDEAVLALLFAADEVRPSVSEFLAGFGLEDARLPVEPFAWGLDSI